jgi:hypothetical protein
MRIRRDLVVRCALVVAVLLVPGEALAQSPTPLPSASPAPLATRAVESLTTPNVSTTSTLTPAGTSTPAIQGLAIHGLVFLDINGDGVAQDRESGVAGVRVRVQREKTLAGEAVQAVSEEDGSFRVGGFAAGTYLVEVVLVVGAKRAPTSCCGGGSWDRGNRWRVAAWRG